MSELPNISDDPAMAACDTEFDDVVCLEEYWQKEAWLSQQEYDEYMAYLIFTTEVHMLLKGIF